MSTLLNTGLVRARRLELGLSERKLAALTGLGQAVVRGIEAGTNHKDVTLGELQRLAQTLSLELAQLLPAVEKETPAGPTTHDEALTSAVAQMGTLLHDIDRLIPVESLAETLGHTLERTHAILDELDRYLRPVGLRLHRLGNSVKVTGTADAVVIDALRRSWRAHLGRRGLDVGQAQLLHQVRTGRRAKALTNDQQVRTAQLTNAGILDRTGSGGATLSADVRYSLLLDAPEKHSPGRPPGEVR